MEPPYREPEETPDAYAWLAALSQRLNADVPSELTAEEMKRVYSLIERLPHHSPIRAIAEHLLHNHAVPLDSIQPVLQPLIRPGRFRWRERQAAVWILGRARLNAAQRAFAAQTLLQVLDRRLEPDLSDRIRRAILRTLPLAALGTISFDNTPYGPPYPAIFLMLMLNITPVVFLLSAQWEHSIALRIRAEAVAALGRLKQPESLDALAAALVDRGRLPFLPVRRKHRQVRQAAALALPGALATLTPEHYGQIRADTMQALCQALTQGDEELALAILQAFIHIGDKTALPVVERLASGVGRAAKERRVADAAKECLTHIRARVENEDAAQILLRASKMPDTPPETLLRPAQFSGETDPRQLLRSSRSQPAPKPGTDEEFVLEVLRQLEQSGDTRALPYVEQIAADPSAPRRIREAAQTVLPALQARVEVDRLTQPPTLPDSAPETQQARLGRETRP